MTRSIPKGIDIRGGEFDWSVWKGHIDFGMTLATRGTTFTDPEFIANWDSMSQLELTRFALHWFSFIPESDPGAQAEHFYSVVKEGSLTEYDGLVVLVREEIGRDIVQAAFSAYVFCRELEYLSGHSPVINVTPHVARMGYCAKLGEYPLWIDDVDTPVPGVPAPWKDWDLWMYASNEVGHNVFNGKLRELDKLAAQ